MIGGTLGYLKWIGINKPDRFVALMARVAPKHVFADVTHRAVSLTASEIEAELRDRGLPPELLDSLRNIPDDVLDWDEDPDPYRLKDVTPDAAQEAQKSPREEEERPAAGVTAAAMSRTKLEVADCIWGLLDRMVTESPSSP